MKGTFKVAGKRGQTMTELIIIIAILAIGSIIAVGIFGQEIKDAFLRMGTAIHGETTDHDTAIDSDLETEGGTRRGMDSFDDEVGGGE